MAVDLKSLLHPDETIVYEARFHMRDLVWIFTWTALVMTAGWRSAVVFFPFAHDADGHFLSAIIVPFLIVFWTRHRAVLVTNRRVIASSEKSRSDLIDVPLHEIAAVARVFMGAGFRTGYVSIQTRSGDAMKLLGGPNPEELCRQLAVAARLPAEGLINIKVILLSNLAVIAGFVTAFSLIGMTIGWLWEAHDAATAIVFLFPALIVGLIVGYYLGAVPAMMLARLVLSPNEAKSLICAGIDPYSTDAENRLERLSGRPYGWMLSLLYGQKIRCD